MGLNDSLGWVPLRSDQLGGFLIGFDWMLWSICMAEGGVGEGLQDLVSPNGVERLDSMFYRFESGLIGFDWIVVHLFGVGRGLQDLVSQRCRVARLDTMFYRVGIDFDRV